MLGQDLHRAIGKRDHAAAKEILLQALGSGWGPAVVNWLDRDEERWPRRTPLAVACYEEDPEMVALLLSFPGINLHKEDPYEVSDPVWITSKNGSVEVLRLLLHDHRAVADSSTREHGACPLGIAFDNLEVIRCLVASRKRLGSPVQLDDAINCLNRKERDCRKSRVPNPALTQVLELLVACESQPAATIKQARAELGADLADAAELFTLVVLVCDGLLRIHEPLANAATAAAKFFAITRRLPMELQMVVCNRAFDSANDSVRPRLPSPDSGRSWRWKMAGEPSIECGCHF